MNRLRGRKKVKDEPTPRPSIDSEASGPFKMFGRSKKPAEEPKQELNLTEALPSSDDFRTSLLMTGLSARFSMLREQDDPTSKIGKASDDSVLFPKRQSRMDFGLGSGLQDIAEDTSLRSPSFARMNSFQSSDDGASTNGSVMNRGKPTEGNNLFGGRQKIYKITSSGNGRVLYDDDVAQSAFQRWRQAEKERRSLEGDETGDGHDSGYLRPESPSNDFSRRRETSSTTSSLPSVARNSTAATSVTSSQPAPSLKDWQPPSATTPNAASPATFQERSVTRTRRLYEQSLNQDIQEQQSSALSRIDTLSRQRHLPGSRTPELPHNASSPTNIANLDRPGERRLPILSKASAPNLRSFSPPTSDSPQPSPAETGSRFSGLEPKPNMTTSPPLSPPISEAEEHPSLAIGPNDRGKATAMGLFSRPTQQYDENRYAQRQRQLQQGRETPTSRHRSESNSSGPASRSRSSSPPNRVASDRAEPNLKTASTAQEDAPKSTFLDLDDDREDEIAAPLRSAPPPPVAPLMAPDRPDDQDHPALRRTALPAHLSLSSKTSEDASEKPQVSPEDSPTLGPGAGLSGMVRQHLRNDSNASSVYGAAPQDEPNFRASMHGHHGHSVDHLGMDSNPWGSEDGNGNHARDASGASNVYSDDAEPGAGTPRETDEFARHLADGARRVREKLTSYVDSDHSRSASPSAPQIEHHPEDIAPPRPNAFSVLRPKSSRGSLADRRGERSRSRPRKVPGFGYSDVPSPLEKPSLDGHDFTRREDTPETSRTASGERVASEEEGAPVHAGLKAFRQARRELQRMKEKEVQQRKQVQPAPQGAPPPPPVRGRSSGRSQDRGPPPVSYGRIPSDGPPNASGSGPGSRPGSRAPSERDRSGSEASNGGQPHYRPRMRTGSSAYEERLHGDTRRPPMMSPYSSHGDSIPGLNSRPSSAAGGNLAATASTPNLPTSPSAPPPLPPINPRRKGIGSPLPRDDQPVSAGPRIPANPDMRGGRGPLLMSEEENGVAQYRQRLRKVTSENNGLSSRGRPERTSPPYGSPRPHPQSTAPGGNLPGGMI
ncbi:hypothetical protein ACRE_037650 [Hapsidospora chrysogenum ATCC 11550]|uniref:Uncharacterized protein n=1 Tax=Hapsidospora chrysogenum (strain ATCC 11550 / CBS 779.69 / DSM 880 / IAM 14645 / JCM 23072 / IMI 49137) TaxID=857340 RepID=A0A086T7W0_HAPC1|nr:hypothetical protein ACRE_037650 [Hapsidospora chrysogenum ATCC 11550]